jgi:peptidoglycan/xylan/chitin deacetylase (PgdA/CDA1 family)
VFGDEREFSRSLYLQWDEAAAMHDAGMTLGGHSHAHQALATLSGSHQHTDVARCAELLASRLPQPVLPSFCYPYGHDDSYTDETIVSLRQAGFTCAFTTQPGTNRPGGAAGRTCSGFGGSIPPT